MKDGAGAGGCAGPASASGDAPDQPCVERARTERCVERVHAMACTHLACTATGLRGVKW